MTSRSSPTNDAVLVPIAIGELFDKMTILQIKAERIGDTDKLANVHKELDALQTVADTLVLVPAVGDVIRDLRQVNEQLWDIEDAIRECEHLQQFDRHFISLARSVYRTNDRRADLKRRLNVLCGSTLCEEKSYAAY